MTNRKPGMAAGPGLHGFEARQSDDPVKRDLELVHVPCGRHLCDVEPGDTLAVLVDVAAEHLTGCRATPKEAPAHV